AAPLAPTFFSHMQDAIRAPRFGDARSEWEFVDAGAARFELALVLHEESGGVTGFLEYDLGVVTPETAERLAHDYARVVAGARAARSCAPTASRARARRRAARRCPFPRARGARPEVAHEPAPALAAAARALAAGRGRGALPVGRVADAVRHRTARGG